MNIVFEIISCLFYPQSPDGLNNEDNVLFINVIQQGSKRILILCIKGGLKHNCIKELLLAELKKSYKGSQIIFLKAPLKITRIPYRDEYKNLF